MHPERSYPGMMNEYGRFLFEGDDFPEIRIGETAGFEPVLETEGVQEDFSSPSIRSMSNFMNSSGSVGLMKMVRLLTLKRTPL